MNLIAPNVKVNALKLVKDSLSLEGVVELETDLEALHLDFRGRCIEAERILQSQEQLFTDRL